MSPNMCDGTRAAKRPLVPASPPADFTQLIARIRAGDERELARLHSALAGPLHRIAANYIGTALQPHIDAEDLVQRVWLILWNGLRSNRFEITTPTQLVALARTLLKRQASRAVQRYRHAMHAMADTAEFNFNVTLVDIRAVPVCPVKKVEVNEQLQSLMKRVSKDDRRMLKLLIGHSIAAAARLLKVEPAALRMRLSRLRVRVRPRVAAADESKNAST
jgi:DNA-directed RNA polymerase specialized sigma24 family protein